MKQRKQNYITIATDGAVLPHDVAAAVRAVEGSADVVYRPSRMAAEAAGVSPAAPNALDAVDASVFSEAGGAGRCAPGVDVETDRPPPVALVMPCATTALRLSPAAVAAGFAACPACTPPPTSTGCCTH